LHLRFERCFLGDPLADQRAGRFTVVEPCALCGIEPGALLFIGDLPRPDVRSVQLGLRRQFPRARFGE
jgi:hypothetical protein